MFGTYKFKIWVKLPSIRAHVCTAAAALCFNSSWRVPRDAFRYGGISYGIVLTAAMIAVALPTALLQLSVGQLSQQDAVGIWRAVPFFRGVGYLRLLISFIASIYTVAYVAIVATNFFYTLNNPIPFWESSVSLQAQELNDTQVYNVSTCVNGTVLPPIQDHPEYYMAMALITVVIWVLFPIVLYSPVKFMKRSFYCVAPLVLVLAITVLSCIGDKNNISLIFDTADWINYTRVNIWHSSIIQALWSCQIAGGYLISAGDTVYSCTDVQWTTMIFVGVNVLAGWCGLIFWYAIGGGGPRDTSVLAVLAQTYKVIEEKSLSAVWPPLIFALLFSSGILTALTLLYPLYDRFKRVGKYKWRYLAVGSSLVGAAAVLSFLALGLPALTIVDDTVVPFLVSITTVLEISPFIFIYGWRVLIVDIEFLVGRDLTKYWVWGWCAVVGIIVLITGWWLIVNFVDAHWVEPPWEASGLVAATGATLTILFTFAIVSVARQVQYDVLGKLKSSFKASRHWGPRDPITHYYWLARREGTARSQPRTRYNRRQLGQFSGNSSFLNANNNSINSNKKLADNKWRSNSDDWLFKYRKQCLAEIFQQHKLGSRMRSKSLDWAIIYNLNHKNSGHTNHLDLGSNDVVSLESVFSAPENNNNVKRSK